MIERFPASHENLGPAGDRVDPDQAMREINAIGNNIRRVSGRIVTEPDRRRRRPRAMAKTEAIGYRLRAVEHYGEPIRSRRTEGRANVALYLRNGLEGPPPHWVQHKATWPKVNDPQQDHPARATLVKELFHAPTVVVGHGPQAPNPRLPDATNRALVEAREEWVEITARILGNHEHVVWLGDPNFLLDDVIRKLGDPKAAVGGDGTDAVLVRGYTVEDDPTPGVVNGVPMMTDHRKVLLTRLVLR